MAIDTQEARRFVDGMNGRGIDPIPDYLLDEAEQKKVFVFNVMAHERKRDYVPGLGCVIIPACEPGRPYSKPFIVPGLIFEHYDAGEGRLLFRSAPARSYTAKNGRRTPGVLDDILSPNTPRGRFSPNLVQYGCFASDNAVPSPVELEQARKEIRQTAEMFVRDADAHWAAGSKGEINSVHREMGEYLKIMKPWMEASVSQELENCPACGTTIKKGVAKCSACSAILDPVKWAQFSGEPIHRGPGRPPKLPE